jgi:hypothetical protein
MSLQVSNSLHHLLSLSFGHAALARFPVFVWLSQNLLVAASGAVFIESP